MKYSFDQYLHEFAVWTAARASQRGFTTTQNIKDAINASGLHHKTTLNQFNDHTEFDNWHKAKCNRIIKYLKRLKLKPKVTYGRVSKIVNIYLKTSIIIPHNGKGKKVALIHPPIDRILLTNLRKDNKELKIDQLNWTELTMPQYFKLINKLRRLDFQNFWEVEKYWESTNTKSVVS